jgi:hypothetical protein
MKLYMTSSLQLIESILKDGIRLQAKQNLGYPHTTTLMLMKTNPTIKGLDLSRGLQGSRFEMGKLRTAAATSRKMGIAPTPLM